MILTDCLNSPLFSPTVIKFDVGVISDRYDGYIGITKRRLKRGAVAVISGGGTFGMVSIARQFANDQHVMIIRNGWFSYRWSKIPEKGKIASSTNVTVARREDAGGSNQMAPFESLPVDEIVAAIRDEKPAALPLLRQSHPAMSAMSKKAGDYGNL